MSLPGKFSYGCAVPSCQNRYFCGIRDNSYKNKRFHKFPRDMKRRQEWFKIMGLEFNTKSTYLCGDHFEEKCFTSTLRERLLKFAVPSLKPQINVFEPVITKEDKESGTRFLNKHQPWTSSDYIASISNCISKEEVQIMETASSAEIPSNNNETETHIFELEAEDVCVKECRFCMKQITDSKNIFEDFIDDNLPICLAVNVCLYPIQVDIKDPLSKYICSECLKTLSSFAKFRWFVLRNDKIQRKYLADNFISISKKSQGQEPNVDMENETRFMQTIGIEHRLEQTSFSTSNQPKSTYKDKEDRNVSKENVSPFQQVANSSIPMDSNKSTLATPLFSSTASAKALQKHSSNKAQKEGLMPNTTILEQNLKQSDSNVDVSNGSQTTYDNNPFCLANGYLMEHKLLKGSSRYLKCALAKCPAIGSQEVLIPGVFENKVSIIKPHNHKKPTEIEIKKQKFISVIRKKLQSVKGSNIKIIYDEACKLDPDLAQLLPMKMIMEDICDL